MTDNPSAAAVVCFNNRYVETEDPTHVSLQALCEAFELSDAEMDLAFIRSRNSKHVVATLPQDTLPAQTPDEQGGLSAVYDLVIRGRENDGETSVKREKGIAAADTQSVMDETSGTHSGSVKNEYAADTKQQQSSNSELTNPNGKNISSDPSAQAAHDGDEDGDDGQEESLRQLAQLGAVRLLGKQDPRFNVLDPYQPIMSPGLLTGIVYPASHYSPYRLQRDPLMRANVQQHLHAHQEKQMQQQQQRAGGATAPAANPVSLPPAGTTRKVKYTAIGVDYRATTAPYGSTAPYRSTPELYENTLKADFVDQYLEQEERRLSGETAASASSGNGPDANSSSRYSPDAAAARAFPATKRQREEAAARYRPDLVVQSEEQTKDLLDGLMAVAAQTKAAFTLKDLNEQRNKPEDIKPKLEDLR